MVSRVINQCTVRAGVTRKTLVSLFCCIFVGRR
jgi:hypothetical protein